MQNSKEKRLQIIAHFDGSCDPNPGGEMGMGIHFQIGDKPLRKYSHKEPSTSENTCNVAEYKALEWLLNTLTLEQVGGADINIKGDSKLVVMQMKGIWKIKTGQYRTFATRCKMLLHDLSRHNRVRIEWVPREQNQLADELSK